MAEKSNIQHLRDIIVELTPVNAAKQEEAFEFIRAIEEEIDEQDKEIKRLKDDDDDEDERPDYENSDDVGLDTFNWELDNGNLRIQQEVENFVQILKKKYIGVTT